MEACRRATNDPDCDKLAHCVGACIVRKCGAVVFSWCLKWIGDLMPGSGMLDPNEGVGACRCGCMTARPAAGVGRAWRTTCLRGTRCSRAFAQWFRFREQRLANSRLPLLEMWYTPH